MNKMIFSNIYIHILCLLYWAVCVVSFKMHTISLHFILLSFEFVLKSNFMSFVFETSAENAYKIINKFKYYWKYQCKDNNKIFT